MNKEQQKSALELQVEKFFPVRQALLFVAPEPYQAYGGGLRVVPSFTTYSACEQPVPQPVKLK
jgi:hypothetical protein